MLGELIGIDAEDIATIDEVLREVDGTDNLSAIGGNTSLATTKGITFVFFSYGYFHHATGRTAQHAQDASDHQLANTSK